jgi:hypothetical protein
VSGILTLVPNPTATGQAVLVLEGLGPGQTAIQVTVRDAEGRIVFHTETEALQGDFNQRVDLLGKAPGVYMVEVATGKLRAVGRLVIL